MKFLNSLLPTYPEITNNLSTELLEISEFSQLVNKTTDNINGFKGYQLFIQRFLSPLTPYKEVLIKHSMGSGKTCTAFLVIQMYYSFKKHKCLILTQNKSQGKNVKELLKTCITYLQDIKGYEKNLLEKYLEDNLLFETFGSIAKRGEGEKGRKRFQNFLKGIHIIVIDEAHTIHHKDTELQLYLDIMNLLTEARERNIRIILITGTPIMNHFSKLFQLMDLILPQDKRFSKLQDEQNTILTNAAQDHNFSETEQSSEKKINEFYFTKEGNLKPNIEDEIRSRFAGRISSFQIVNRSVNLIEMGVYYNFKTKLGEQYQSPDTSRTKVVINEMIGYQKDQYLRALEFKAENEQMIAFFSKELVEGRTKKHQQTITNLPKNLDNKDITNELQLNSILYYTILKELQSNPKEAAFYYNDLVQYPYNKLFALILKKNGFVHLIQETQSTTTIDTVLKYVRQNDKNGMRQRFAVISSDFGTSSPNEIDKLVQIFSHPNNRYGEFLRLIVGSKKIAFGYNLINGRQAHIVLQWNSPIMNQAISRVIRGRTNFNKPDEKYVKVYRHFISPGIKEGEKLFEKETVFERRLKSVEEKEIRNAKILHLVDTMAIDCRVHQSYHVSNLNLDNTVECNFLPCKLNYDCGNNRQMNVKVDNAFLFHEQKGQLDFLHSLISDLIFKNTSSFSLNDLVLLSSNNLTENEVIFYLLKIIEEQTIFEDVLGFPKILDQFQDVIFTKDPNSFDLQSSSVHKISQIISPMVLHFDYSSLTLDSHFAIINERNNILDVFRQTTKQDILKKYNLLSILAKVWVFEFVLTQNSDKTSKLVLTTLKETEIGNFIEDYSTLSKIKNDILYAHKIISEYHIKEHKVKRPEDIIEGIRIYSKFSKQWSFLTNISTTDFLQSDLEIAKLLQNIKTKEPIGATAIDQNELNFRFIADGNKIKRIQWSDSKEGSRKGRECKTLTRDMLRGYFIEYLNLLKTNFKLYKPKLKDFVKKYKIKIEKESSNAIEEAFEKGYLSLKTTKIACEFLFDLQTSLFQ